MAKKTALEQALFESEQIVQVVTENAKKMLYDQIQPQISQNLSEGIDDLLNDDKEDKEEDAVADDAPATDEVPADDAEVTDEVPADDAPADDAPVDDAPADDTDAEGGVDALGGADDAEGDDSLDAMGSSTDDAPADDNMSMDMGGAVDTDVSGAIGDVLDATNMSDDDLIKVFKKVSDNTEIEVVKNADDTLSIKKDGEEFIVKLNENEDKESFLNSILSGDEGHGEQGGQEDDEVIYEITLDEDEIEGSSFGQDAPQEETIEEVARTHSDGHNMTRKPEGFYKYASSRLRSAINESVAQDKGKQLLQEAEVLKSNNAQLITEAVALKADLKNHKDALRLMKENLESVALINHKLLYVNKIFCENATTLNEKQEILARFDDESIANQKDVKALYKTIATEMKQAIKESVTSKIASPSTGKGESLLESANKQANLDPKIERMKQLMYASHKK